MLALLQQGTIELHGQFVLGSNYTFLVRLQQDQVELPAVYKPMRGEMPLWDFPEASLARREVAAWVVSQALSWGLVPPTVLRQDGPFGPGSVQQYITYNPNRHYFTFKPAERLLLQPVALFDLLINNADRKGSHVFFQTRTRRLFAIDHGLCFHAEDKLRTVIWDFAGQPIPAGLLLDLANLQQALPDLSLQLQPWLDPLEIEAFAVRLHRLLQAPVFPDPPADRRAFPFPPL